MPMVSVVTLWYKRDKRYRRESHWCGYACWVWVGYVGVSVGCGAAVGAVVGYVLESLLCVRGVTVIRGELL